MVNRHYKILIVEPDKKWFEKMESALEKRDYKVSRATHANEALEISRKIMPDLIIVEQELQDSVDGVELTTDIREDHALKQVPVIFYSETADKYTRIAALDAGADLFISKTNGKKVFTKMVEALLRRCYEMTEPVNVNKQFGDIQIDFDQVSVLKENSPIKLSKKEFELLLLLTSKPGKVFRRQNILNKLWGDDIIVGDRNIDTHIKKLRKKLGKEYIQTARGIGYKFTYSEVQ